MDNTKYDIIKTFCANLEAELLHGLEEGRTIAVEVMHLKNDLISTGIVRIHLTLPMDLEGGFVALEANADNFKFHKDL